MQKPLTIWLLYSLAIVYGSLIPFGFDPPALEGVGEHLGAIPWLQLGATQRADWIANLLIYLPWGYLGMSALASRLRAAPAMIVVVSILAAFVLAIELAQLYFPARTVSLNDILAEVLGACIGIALWLGGARSLRRLIRATFGEGDKALQAGLLLYLIVYLLIAFFPFDFVVSGKEISAKLTSDRVGWVMAAAASEDAARFFTKFGVEILAAMPLGLLLALRLPTLGAHLFRVLLIGLLFGAAIEVVELFVFSAISQGSSILTRAIGIAAGAGLLKVFRSASQSAAFDLEAVLTWIRRTALILVGPYLYLLYRLFQLDGDGTAPLSSAAAIERLDQLSFIPFYYHYYTNETAALASFVSNFAVYACAGGIVWALSKPWAGGRLSPKAPVVAAFIGLTLATLIETGRLFRPELRPDPTDLLIGAFAAVCGMLVSDWVWRVWRHSFGPVGIGAGSPHASREHAAQKPAQTDTRDQPIRPEGPDKSDKSDKQKIRLEGSERSQRRLRPDRPAVLTPSIRAETEPKLFYRIAAVGLGLLACLLALSLPAVGLWLTPLLVLYLVLLLRFPASWLLLLPGILVVFNLTPWTGRFFFDESDAFVMMTLAAWLWQGPFVKTWWRLSALNLSLIVLVAAYAGSALIMLWPLPSFDDLNALSSYHSPYNALRVAKSVLWAFLLWPVLHAAGARGYDVRTQFARGVLIALTGVALVVLWERWAFPGLFNFNNNYRVTASFASMHIGGAFIDGFFAISIPLIALMLNWRREWLLGMVPLTVMAVYAALMTFSRGTYGALAVTGVILAATALLRFSSRVRISGLLTASVAIALGIVVAASVLRGSFIQDRFATIEEDLGLRVSHWEDALSQMESGLLVRLLGMGPGSFPASYLWNHLDGDIPTTYRFQEENGQRYLRAALASPMYLDQRIRLDPYQTYTLSVRYRNDQDRVYPSVALCEKGLLYSYRCSWSRLKQDRGQQGWRTTTVQVTPASRSKPWDLERPHTLSLELAGRSQILDVAGISLRDQDNRELLDNGDFSDGLDHWFFTVDNNWPWHIENMLIAAYFETGLIGAGAFVLLVVIAGARLVRLSLRGDTDAPVFLASLVSLMTIGLFNSLFEDPRLGLLLWLFLIVVADRALATAHRSVRVARSENWGAPHLSQSPAMAQEGRKHWA